MHRLALPMVTATSQPCARAVLVHGCRSLALVLLAALLLLAAGARADTGQRLHFAGLSFVSNHSEIAARFPHSSRALQYDGGNARAEDFEKHLSALVSQVSNPALPEVTTQLGQVSEGHSRALSFAVSDESFELQRFEGKYLAIYALSAQILFYEMSTPPRLVGSFPVRVRFTDVSAAAPSPAQMQATFRRMYFDPQHPASLTTQWLARLAQVNPKDGAKLLQVRSVKLEDKALAALPPDLRPEQAASEIAQFFESAVSSRVRLPMVPYTPGHAIAGKIALRFADGHAVDLDTPIADFALDLTVREFRKLQEEAGTVWRVAYGSFVTLTATSLGLKEELANGKFRHAVSVTLPKQSGIALQDWAQHRVVLQALLDRLAAQIDQPDRAWVESTSSTANAVAQLSQLSQRIR